MPKPKKQRGGGGGGKGGGGGGGGGGEGGGGGGGGEVGGGSAYGTAVNGGAVSRNSHKYSFTVYHYCQTDFCSVFPFSNMPCGDAGRGGAVCRHSQKL